MYIHSIHLSHSSAHILLIQHYLGTSIVLQTKQTKKETTAKKRDRLTDSTTHPKKENKGKKKLPKSLVSQHVSM